MAYSGTTASATAANPPIKVETGIWGERTTDSVGSTKLTGRQMWHYRTTDPSTAVFTADYFTDALQLGMHPGDALLIISDTGSTLSLVWTVVGQVSSDGAAALSTGSMITSTFA